MFIDTDTTFTFKKQRGTTHSTVSGAGKDMNFWVFLKETLDTESERGSAHVLTYRGRLWKDCEILDSIAQEL